MTDTSETTSDAKPCATGWVKLYTASGALVTLPVTEKPLDYAAMVANVDSMLNAGFLVSPPGLEQGEQRETIGYVLRQTSKEGTPVLVLYSVEEHKKFSVLKVYIDNDEQMKDFEYATKMSLHSLPIYEGTDRPERGKMKVQEKYFCRPPKPFDVVFIQNPDYNEQADREARAKGGEPYKIPRRLFKRWAIQRPAEPCGLDADATTPGNRTETATVKEPPKTIKELENRLKSFESRLVNEQRANPGDVFKTLDYWAKHRKPVIDGCHLAMVPYTNWPDSAAQLAAEAVAKAYAATTKR